MGVLSANGHVEYGQEVKEVTLARAAIDGIPGGLPAHGAHGRR
jgi:hypothetical protein